MLKNSSFKLQTQITKEKMKRIRVDKYLKGRIWILELYNQNFTIYPVISIIFKHK